MVFVVAEVGVNWDGDFDLAKEMIIKSHEAGCNAVKFQAFNENIVENHPEKVRLMNSTITENNIETINKIAKSIGIEWFCTPMYPEAVQLLDPFVKRFKIRSADSKPLLEGTSSELINLIMKTDKEILVSSQSSPKGTKYFERGRIKWLYCVPKYPCSITDLDFTNMKDFDGYSNHYPHFIAPLVATILGAKVIEVHLTSDKSKDFIDNNVSFDYDELKNLVNLIRISEKIKFPIFQNSGSS